MRRPDVPRGGKNGVEHRIASVTIQGFKSVVKQTIELGRLNVFVGANGSGKTSLLDGRRITGAELFTLVDWASNATVGRPLPEATATPASPALSFG